MPSIRRSVLFRDGFSPCFTTAESSPIPKRVELFFGFMVFVKYSINANSPRLRSSVFEVFLSSSIRQKYTSLIKIKLYKGSRFYLILN